MTSERQDGVETTTATERYLWDRSGPGDPEIEGLEQVLGAMRHDEDRAAERRPDPAALRLRGRGWMPLAAAVAVAAAGAWLLVDPGADRAAFEVTALAGFAKIDDDPMAGDGRLAVGSWLETDAASQVRVEVADIGSVTVHPNSRIGLLETGESAVHRLQLDRGRIDAFILAPPRLFFVNTPSAVAVDLGCEYRLEVDESGNGTLEVTLGLVALEDGVYGTTVPMHARCRLRAGFGPGLPFFGDASKAFRDAVEQFDRGEDRDAAVTAILAQSRPRDTLTLWHLLPRVDDNARVVDRIEKLGGLPDGLSVEQARALDPAMLAYWWVGEK